MEEFHLKDDFVCISKGQVEYSRVSKKSKTRIDFVLSNTNGLCLSLEYKNIQGLDHKAIFSEYSLSTDSYERLGVPKERMFDSFIFPKSLEEDECFLKGAISFSPINTTMKLATNAT